MKDIFVILILILFTGIANTVSKQHSVTPIGDGDLFDGLMCDGVEDETVHIIEQSGYRWGVVNNYSVCENAAIKRGLDSFIIWRFSLVDIRSEKLGCSKICQFANFYTLLQTPQVCTTDYKNHTAREGDPPCVYQISISTQIISSTTVEQTTTTTPGGISSNVAQTTTSTPTPIIIESSTVEETVSTTTAHISTIFSQAFTTTPGGISSNVAQITTSTPTPIIIESSTVEESVSTTIAHISTTSSQAFTTTPVPVTISVNPSTTTAFIFSFAESTSSKSGLGESSTMPHQISTTTPTPDMITFSTNPSQNSNITTAITTSNATERAISKSQLETNSTTTPIPASVAIYNNTILIVVVTGICICSAFLYVMYMYISKLKKIHPSVPDYCYYHTKKNVNATEIVPKRIDWIDDDIFVM